MRPLQDLLDAHPLPPGGDGSKDDRGTVFVVGGPPSCPGAVVLTATAALRVGSGRVQLATHPTVAPLLGVHVPELAVFGWDQRSSPPSDVAARLGEADVVVVGPGHTTDSLDELVVRAVAHRTRPDATLVLDAGALHVAPALAPNHRVVIAPNPSEAASLLDAASDDEAALASELSERMGQPVAVRGARTVVAEDGERWCLDEAPSGLGTPGSGDVVIGALAGLLATAVAPLPALAWAVALHARAGARLAARTPVGYLARELVDELPVVRV